MPFESDVILYGGQTYDVVYHKDTKFESDVILYGGQTSHPRFKTKP